MDGRLFIHSEGEAAANQAEIDNCENEGVNTMETNHTAAEVYRDDGQWIVSWRGRDTMQKLTGDKGTFIVVARCDFESNAAFIVKAVNSHDDLLAALKGIVEWMEQHHPEAAKHIPNARTAIAKAEGQPCK
jgi:hypothetical protein